MDVGSTQAGLQAQFDGVDTFASTYWSSTADTLNSGVVWTFDTSSGIQGRDVDSELWYALAVRPGDVAVSVPEPQSLALVLLALGATVVAVRRRRSR